MEHNLTDAQVADFNKYYNQANDKLKDLIYLDGYHRSDLSKNDKSKINEAIALFERCLALVPRHWPTLFFIGKAYQRLGEFAQSLNYFEQAMDVEPVNHNIPQEASLVCVNMNDIEKAIKYSAEANKRKSDFPPLMGNHAMNLIIAGHNDEAIAIITKALELDPEDKINQNIQKIIMDIVQGKRPRITCEEAI